MKPFKSCVPAWLAAVALATAAEAGTTPGELRSHATIQSVGIEWDIAGDSNHNATCRVQYRAKGSAAWKSALPLFRVDFHGWYAGAKADRACNMLAGSVLFLQPGTAYEVRLDLSDPDGGSATKTLAIQTRPVPSLVTDGRKLHVTPGDGGGDGSPAKPFRGLKAAQAAAKPGDVFLLHAGRYGEFAFNRPGEPGRHVAWKSAGDGAAVFERVEVAASHVWLEGLTFRRGAQSNGLKAQGAVADAVVSRCSFTGFHYSIALRPECRDWYIADNVIVGDNDPITGGIGGEGIELNHSSGHVVCHNRISRTADGVSYCHRNCDIHHNDIFDVSDDGLEPDYGYANNRMWRNRLTNCHHAGLSFQPMYCGPWYFIRNQVIGRGVAFKFRVQDRFLLAHNTFVRWGMMDSHMHHLLTSLSRNNLYIVAGGTQPVWVAARQKPNPYTLPDSFAVNWMTDVDYDGFDWGDAPAAFLWDNKRCADLASFAQAAGIERHAVRVEKAKIFETWNVPPEPGRVEPHNLTLRAGCNAMDAGAVLPNINDDFAGKAPDLGAHEHGQPPPHYGPRAQR